ncbi:MAG: FKBP-type peptidyl-prolyl cis-trans isomerase [Bacteroidetes bacterium]|nr:FKBP-type peptidyl-prolyl cis-trans isomerase [Bacteroidota bacterium]
MSLLNKEFTTESGLTYKIIHEGKGIRAKAGDMVFVHYTGKLTNDTVFDSSLFRNQPFKFKLGTGQVIKGWDEGIALLNVGDKAIFTIPSKLGYGERNMGKIPSNSTLIFEVELLSIVEKPKPFDVKGKDTITTSSGLKYIKINETKGAAATAGSNVYVHYTGYLSDGSVFDSSVERGEPFTFQLGQGRVIAGWDEGIAKLKVGEKAQLIVPHTLGYGERGFPPVIPENALLIFDVELIDVKVADSHQHRPGDGHNH